MSSKQVIFKEAKIEGRALIFQSYPIVGVIGLISLIDATADSKTFRYTVDGVSFSEWIALNQININEAFLTFKKHDTPIFEIKVSEATQTQNSIDLTYDYESAVIQSVVFKQSVFSKFFKSDDIRVLNWYLNVVLKLYEVGSLPDYIDRKNRFSDDIDFLQLWGSIAKFFAFYVIYAREFANFHNNKDLLFEFLQQRGLQLSQSTTLEELSILMSSFYKEVAKRGTMAIIDKKSDGADVEGELLRLLHFTDGVDEMIFNPRLPQHVGWNIGKSSPLFRELHLHENTNKVHKNTLTTLGNTISFEKNFIIDSLLDYCFSLEAKGAGTLTIIVTTFDKDGVGVSLISYRTGIATSRFINNAKLYRGDKFLPIKFFLQNCKKKANTNTQTQMKQGQDLILAEKAVFVNFQILATDIEVQNFSFKPNKTPYSAGFLQTNNFLDIFYKNNNFEFNFTDLYHYISKYLIPYNSNLALVDMHDITNVDQLTQQAEQPSFWSGAAPFCQKESDGYQNTGVYIYALLIHTPSGTMKPNLPEDPDYIPPVTNISLCPWLPPTTTTTTTVPPTTTTTTLFPTTTTTTTIVPTTTTTTNPPPTTTTTTQQANIYITDKVSDIGAGTCMYKLHVEVMTFTGFANVVGTKGSRVKLSRVNVDPFGADLVIPIVTPVGGDVFNSTPVTIPVGVYNCSIYLNGAPVSMDDDVIIDGAISYGYDQDYYNGITQAEAHLFIPSNNQPPL